MHWDSVRGYVRTVCGTVFRLGRDCVDDGMGMGMELGFRLREDQDQDRDGDEIDDVRSRTK